MAAWWAGSQVTPRPGALDYATWDRTTIVLPEIAFEENLSFPPHKGWAQLDDRVEVDESVATATIAWRAKVLPPETTFELELIEEISQRAVKKIGRTSSLSRSIRWGTVLRTPELLEELRELNPTGDEDGYTFRIRLETYLGKRWVAPGYTSLPFTVRLGGRAEEVSPGPNPSAYHALYRFHAEQKVTAPRIARRDDPFDVPRVKLVGEGDRSKEAAIDLSPLLVAIEGAMLEQPEAVGPWTLNAGSPAAPDLVGALRPRTSIREMDLPQEFVEARWNLFSVTAGRMAQRRSWTSGTRPSGPWRKGTASPTREQLASIGSKMRGPVAAGDQMRFAAVAAIDTVEVTINDGTEEYPVLLVPPIHPVSLAWLLEFSDLIGQWTLGPFVAAHKPTYQGVVESMSVGPRSMVLATPTSGATPDWWGSAET